MTISLSDINDLSGNHSSAIDALNFAINTLESALAVSRYSFKDVNRPYLEMRRDAPYCIHETSIPGTRILVNRNYKPLGSNIETGGKQLEYEDFKNLHVRLTIDQIAAVTNRGRGGYLFGDENPPWKNRTTAKAYLKRLVLLRGLLETSNV